jgi:hypothetical protein
MKKRPIYAMLYFNVNEEGATKVEKYRFPWTFSFLFCWKCFFSLTTLNFTRLPFFFSLLIFSYLKFSFCYLFIDYIQNIAAEQCFQLHLITIEMNDLPLQMIYILKIKSRTCSKPSIIFKYLYMCELLRVD